jgi:membrane protein DedA with SNARE-associated domain
VLTEPALPFGAAVLVYAAITDKLVDFATNVIGDLGLAGVFVLMFFESACIPIPSEATMLFAGFNVSDGRFTLLEITLVGTIANVMGSWLAYAVGYFGRIDLIEKHGNKLHVSPKHLAWADRWFERHGEATVFFTRLMPIIRTFISLPAGVARMPFWRFTLFTFLGCLPWVFALGFIGRQVGDNWEDWKNALHYLDYVVLAAIVVGIAYLVIRNRRRGGETEPAADAPGG